HGLPGLRIASLATDMAALSLAQKAAHDLLEKDSELKLPEHQVLKNAVEELISASADTLN
ncbi:MAG: hypothetical protein GX189_09625, partial [Clostridiales bacterium]|nr:hypothetical protein [Clostridiales bacterium]